MTDSKPVRLAAGLLALLVVVSGVAAAVPGGQALVVEDAETGETLLTVPVEEETVVALEYTHSVEKTPVLDVYAVRDDELVMTRMEFESFGWGLPARANVTNENGTFVFDPEGSFSELYVTPGTVADHRLHVGDRTYDLVTVAGGEHSVRLHVVQRSLLRTGIERLTP
ncbi:hypothetical protein SAMN04487949_0087 [Halogranum gelatinilyticum]|uniref:DUF1850 domain-containing protein n=1 Tax=Halogranum gelatinilyticum TaxID=660521 RepID=A0A1G9NTL3_9EURY|nr:DUF1850 domain-containing protein [Halogranum gelatinilyticum]SDL89335.1 hypothetical protein SAMN04487949_0087 [Halogranum gelatinilyticum]